MKISIIGVGNLGATCADMLVHKGIGKEIVLLDRNAGLAEGKAIDLKQKQSIEGKSIIQITGSTNDYTKTAGSDIIIVTAGIVRNPGMSREEMIAINATIIEQVVNQAIDQSPTAILIMVTNPLDVVTYMAWKLSKLPSNQIIGMAGTLDLARYRTLIAAELNVSPNNIQAMLIGNHGDAMIPLPRYTTVQGIPISEFLSSDKISNIIKQTKEGGGAIVKLMGFSAWYAPSAATIQMVEAIALDQKQVMSVCTPLEGAYGIDDCCLSVPVVLGKNGVEKIIILQLNEEEKSQLVESTEVVRELIKQIP